THVREALIYALRYDSNPGVRLKALEGLGPYVKDDVRVRDVVLQALMSDSNQGVRNQAIHLLEPCKADSSVRSVFQRLAENDQNQYIRSLAAAKNLKLKVDVGAVRVVGGSQPGINYVIRTRTYGSAEDQARREFESYKINAYVRGDTAYIIGDWVGGRPRKFSGEFIINV